MDIKLINRLAMIGVAAVGIGNILFNTSSPQGVREIQDQVFMDMNDIITLEEEVEKRRRHHEKELYYKNYRIILED